MIPSKFHRALLRLPESERPQYCYTTAAAMPLRKFPLAKELIEYSLELEGSWLDRMRAHDNLADLYERQGDYTAALQSYRLALEAVPAELQEKYRADSASRMLVCRIHLDDFNHTDELRRLYEQSQKLDDFSRSFQKCRFYLALAQIVISLHDGDLPTARAAFALAKSILRPGSQGPLTALLKRKNYAESAGATPEARAFLKRIQAQLR